MIFLERERERRVQGRCRDGKEDEEEERWGGNRSAGEKRRAQFKIIESYVKGALPDIAFPLWAFKPLIDYGGKFNRARM